MYIVYPPEVISETAFSTPDYSHQAKVVQLFVLIDRPVLALEDYGHVQLLDNEVDHLAGAGRGRHLDPDTGSVGQPRVVGRVHLQDVGLGKN